jgi:hypothetical protein
VSPGIKYANDGKKREQLIKKRTEIIRHHILIHNIRSEIELVWAPHIELKTLVPNRVKAVVDHSRRLGLLVVADLRAMNVQNNKRVDDLSLLRSTRFRQ